MPKSQLNLITTADDFGACEFIDKGILQGINQGVVSCVSAFINFNPRKKRKRGGQYKGSIQAIKDLRTKYPGFPVGLHLTIHSGTPVAKHYLLNQLLVDPNRQDSPFKDINSYNLKVNLTDWIIEQAGIEARAQLKKMRDVLGENPNHISCHYGVLFTFEKLLKEILTDRKLPGISGIPVRNHSLIFQTGARLENDTRREILIKAKEFFKRTSQMRIVGRRRGFGWAKYSFDSAVGSVIALLSLGKRLSLLTEHDCPFPHYMVDSLYRKPLVITKVKKKKTKTTVKIKKWDRKLWNYLKHLPRFIPEVYADEESPNDPMVAELVCHLGAGRVPKTAPNGIDPKYFEGRTLELERLIASKPALRNPNNGVNLVDYDFLDDGGYV